MDFAAIREAIHCPKGQPVLEYIETLTFEDARVQALKILNEHEMEAARRSQPNRGAEELIRFLKSRKVRLGIISRNSRRAIMLALESFRQIRASDFEVIISRDEFMMPKPSPETVLAAGERMGVPTEQILVVGDFAFDIEAGFRAGARTVFLTNRNPSSHCPVTPDYTISELGELMGIEAIIK